ncbi:TraR/DksA C4-type zinc finger protein [Bacillus fonticola]|uniref:hypothetical protein n=1 Tax=Bacillus fonticola TaxID=2728853 RepID=UPI0014759EA5|nr:hypothetical protein [Bacillus fonticola]
MNHTVYEELRKSEEELKRRLDYSLSIPLDPFLKQVMEHELFDTQHAIGKLESGTYGVCEQTGMPLEDYHIATLPTARTLQCFENLQSYGRVSLHDQFAP